MVTIQTTGARDIFDVSRALANEWDVGARNSRKKSLLLVIAVNERTAFTQFSRAVQADLPEGILGEVSQIMRGPLASGRFGTGLNDGVNHFIGSIARKIGFPAEDLDQAQLATADATEPVAAPSPAAEAIEKPPVVKTESNENVRLLTGRLELLNRKRAPRQVPQLNQ